MPARVALAALLAAFVLGPAAATAAAGPVELTVRIEGKDRTLFEGPILSEGHDVQAASDPLPRPCDGTNNGAHASASATPTAASADAMAIAGEGFDGEWYAGFDDYFITRWGPDPEGGGAFWGLLVDGSFTPLGGCQFAAQAGDEVLWAYDAFRSRPFLQLAAADDPSSAPGPALPTASVEQGEALALDVESYSGAMDGAPESVQAVAGALVAPVRTDPVSGYQEIETGDPSAVASAAGGAASVVFSAPGWHRLKADKSGYVRSNRLDVCVEPPGGGSCGPLPADAEVRVPPARPATGSQPGGSEPEAELDRPAPTPPRADGSPAAFSLGRVRLDARTGIARLPASVPGPGRLILGGAGVRRGSIGVGTARTATLTVSATGRALARLRHRGRVRVTAVVSFVPPGGSAEVERRAIALRLGGAAG